jgi:phosphoglycolate phosphatase
MSYRLVVFDWDGTLMDSTGAIVRAAAGAIEELGWPPLAPERIREIIGLGLRESWDRLFPGGPDESFGTFVEAYRSRFFAAEQQTSRLYPGTRGLLGELSERGHLLAVATGKSRRGLDRDFERTGLGHRFAASCTADEARSKPHPEMLLSLIDRTGCTPRQVLMVGDTEFDLEMARRAGVDAVGVVWGAHPAERLRACEPIACLEDLRELAGWLRARRPRD